MAYSARKAGVYITSGTTTTSFTDEATTPDASKKIYTISDSAKRYWDKDSAVTVKKDGIPVSSGFTIQHCGGKIIFDTPLTTETVTVSGEYITYAAWANAKEWTVDVSYDQLDATTFSADGWKQKMGGMNDATVTISKWWEDSTFITNYLTRRMVLVLFAEETNTSTHAGKRYECYAYLDSDSVKCAADGLVEEDLKFRVDGQIYYVDD